MEAYHSADAEKRKAKSMRIIIYNDLVFGGGTETLLRLFTCGFLERGHDVTIVASPEDTEDFKKAFSSEVRCIRARLPKRKYSNKISSTWYYLRCKVFRAISIVRVMAIKYDVAISMIEGHNMKEVALLRAKRKFVWIQCDYKNFHDRTWYKKVFSSRDKEIACMRRYDRIVCVSQTAKEGLIDTVGDTGNICVRYNPIDWKKIRELSEKICYLSRDTSRKLIVSTGRLFPDKNYKCLLDACVLLKNISEFDLWIAGDGPQREELEEYIKSNDLTNVRLLGFVSNPFSAIKQADLFVSSSISETYGLSIQEALILGVPVVAVKCPGVLESLDPRFGVLVDNSSNELAEAIRNLLENPGRLGLYRKAIIDNFSLNNLFEDRMKAIYQLLEEYNV